MNTLYIGIDESGTFASDEQYFVYAGYSIFGTEKFESKMRKYKRQEALLEVGDEVKANGLSQSDKLLLLNVLKNQASFAVAVENRRFYKMFGEDSISKSLVKEDILKYLIFEIINSYELVHIDCINIVIDEQNLVSGIKDNIYISLYKYLFSGYFDQGVYVAPVLNDKIKLTVNYVDSKAFTFVRCADILANDVLNKLKEDKDTGIYLKRFKIL